MFFKNNSSKVHALITEQIKDVEGCLKDFSNFIKAAVNPNTDTDTLRALAAGVHNMENAADRSLRAMIDSLAIPHHFNMKDGDLTLDLPFAFC